VRQVHSHAARKCQADKRTPLSARRATRMPCTRFESDTLKEASVRQRHEHGLVAGVTPASRREMDEKFVRCVSLLAAAIPRGGKRARIIWQEKKRLACEDLNQKMKSENSVPLAVVPILQTRRASSNKTHIVHTHGSNGKRIHDAGVVPRPHDALHPSKAGLWPVPLDE
jgi:hypothetical protein